MGCHVDTYIINSIECGVSGGRFSRLSDDVCKRSDGNTSTLGEVGLVKCFDLGPIIIILSQEVMLLLFHPLLCK